MTSRVIENETDRRQVITLIKNRTLPITVNILKGKKRSNLQNKLQREWLNNAADQLKDDTAEGYRAYCKLHFGVGILINENDIFREKYNRIIKPLSYEQKIELMQEPFDFPVTRIMTRGQKAQYLDAMKSHFESLGVRLTMPE